VKNTVKVLKWCKWFTVNFMINTPVHKEQPPRRCQL